MTCAHSCWVIRCCGTHLPTLHNLQIFILPQTETLSRSSVSSARLFFLCGPRLIAHLTSSHNLLTSTSGVLSCGPPLVPERVRQVVEERKHADKRVEELEAELAKNVATELFAEMSGAGSLFRRHYHRTDDSSSALGFLQSVSMTFAALLSESSPAFLLVLSSSPPSQSSTSTSVVLISASDERLAKAAGEGVKAKLGVKCGGKGLRWSGKWVGVWKDAREGQLMQEMVNGIVDA